MTMVKGKGGGARQAMATATPERSPILFFSLLIASARQLFECHLRRICERPWKAKSLQWSNAGRGEDVEEKSCMVMRNQADDQEIVAERKDERRRESRMPRTNGPSSQGETESEGTGETNATCNALSSKQ